MFEDLFDEESLQAFDENQREVLLKIKDGLAEEVADEITQRVEEQVEQRLENKDETDQLKFVGDEDDDRYKFVKKDQKRLNNMLSIWKNNGVVPGFQDRVEYSKLAALDTAYTKETRDNLSSTDHPLLIGRVISEVVKEAIEPNIVLTPLLQRINFTHGTQLTFPAVGALTAADIPEGGEYPERSLDFAGQVVATIGKSGIAVKMTEETIRYSLYDVMSMHLRAAGRALIRWKEQKVSDMITTNAGAANTIFDNTSATYSSTTGRDFGGTYNGALTLDDMFKAYATFINRGFSPNTILMNPFGWQIFADEALQRIFGFINGGSMWNQHQGSPGSAPQWSNGGSFGNGLLQNTQPSSPQNLATTFTNIPGIFPYAFRIVVTPYMPYYSTSNTTDMVLCDTNELGVLVVDEEVTTDQWEDPARDIMKVKLRERYAVAPVNEGKGTGIMKGIYLGRSHDFTHNIGVSLTTGDLGNQLKGDDGYSAAVTTNT
jgi:hypothetical protein